MHAWLCNQPVGPDELVWTEMPTPEPGEGEVRVRIEAASINFPDLLIVQNKYQVKPPLPFVPGCEYAGVIESVGGNVVDRCAGDRVACFAGIGSFATHVIARSEQLVALPREVSSIDGSAFVMTYATAHHALHERGSLRPEDTVLILGAAGGVGSAAIQVAKAHGATVIAAALTEDMCAYCDRLGADATINLSGCDLRQRIRELTNGKGPDLVLDTVGGVHAEPSLRSIAWSGRYLIVGFASGTVPSIPLNLPLLKGASLIGVFWGDFAKRAPAANALMMESLVEMLRTQSIKPSINREIPMSALKDAYKLIESGSILGKLVLVN